MEYLLNLNWINHLLEYLLNIELLCQSSKFRVLSRYNGGYHEPTAAKTFQLHETARPIRVNSLPNTRYLTGLTQLNAFAGKLAKNYYLAVWPWSARPTGRPHALLSLRKLLQMIFLILSFTDHAGILWSAFCHLLMVRLRSHSQVPGIFMKPEAERTPYGALYVFLNCILRRNWSHKPRNKISSVDLLSLPGRIKNERESLLRVFIK